jgi:hypothetical protein
LAKKAADRLGLTSDDLDIEGECRAWVDVSEDCSLPLLERQLLRKA